MGDSAGLTRRTMISAGSAALGMAALSEGCTSPRPPGQPGASADTFAGLRAGEQRIIGGMTLCWCPPGSFRMGSPLSEPQRRADEAQVDVTLSHGFWIGKFSVTQAEWTRVIGALPGELSAGAGDRFPLYNVNFAEAEAFCDRFTAMARAANDLPPTWTARLPTEAQWEYACRAGTTTATIFGDQLSSLQANFRGEHPYNGAEPGPTLGRTSEVGSYSANAWGLHDMHGNLFDWCRDWYHGRLPGGADPDLWSASSTALLNGDGTISRVRRGGCWSDHGWPCRSACRLRYEPERRADHIGFRVVAVPT
jgi:formylglycine-generating enzyme required for sulfatase activity